MSFIRVNDIHRIRIANIFAYCEVTGEMPEGDIDNFPPQMRQRALLLKHCIAVNVAVGPENERTFCSFPDDASLREALAKLDRTLPHFFRENEWRASLSTVISVATSVDRGEDVGVALLYANGTGICFEQRDSEKRAELFARLDAALEAI